MIELETDMWELRADAHVITTNGSVRTDGQAVMGRGCARQALNKFSGKDSGCGRALPLTFGDKLKEHGNHVYFLGHYGSGQHYRLVSFPVKHYWYQRADLKLIERSAGELVDLVGTKKWLLVIVPRPGCGNGQLRWEDVKPVLEPVFDDRFVVVSKRGSR